MASGIALAGYAARFKNDRAEENRKNIDIFTKEFDRAKKDRAQALSDGLDGWDFKVKGMDTHLNGEIATQLKDKSKWYWDQYNQGKRPWDPSTPEGQEWANMKYDINNNLYQSEQHGNLFDGWVKEYVNHEEDYAPSSKEELNKFFNMSIAEQTQYMKENGSPLSPVETDWNQYAVEVAGDIGVTDIGEATFVNGKAVVATSKMTDAEKLEYTIMYTWNNAPGLKKAHTLDEWRTLVNSKTSIKKGIKGLGGGSGGTSSWNGNKLTVGNYTFGVEKNKVTAAPVGGAVPGGLGEVATITFTYKGDGEEKPILIPIDAQGKVSVKGNIINMQQLQTGKWNVIIRSSEKQDVNGREIEKGKVYEIPYEYAANTIETAYASPHPDLILKDLNSQGNTSTDSNKVNTKQSSNPDKKGGTWKTPDL
jgi:hypothetical protein